MAFLSSPAGHVMFIEGLINWSLKAYFAVPILDYNIVRKNCKKSLRREIWKGLKRTEKDKDLFQWEIWGHPHFQPWQHTVLETRTCFLKKTSVSSWTRSDSWISCKFCQSNQNCTLLLNNNITVCSMCTSYKNHFSNFSFQTLELELAIFLLTGNKIFCLIDLGVIHNDVTQFWTIF